MAEAAVAEAVGAEAEAAEAAVVAEAQVAVVVAVGRRSLRGRCGRPGTGTCSR